MTVEDVRNYVPESADKRTQADWDAMSLEDLRAEWERGPKFSRPPYPKDRNRFDRLSKVQSEIAVRLNTRPPDGVTHGARRKDGGDG